ncbi:MAG: hypothetical protein ACLFRG_05180 [Desulfococcaceae bacterium]
MRIPARFRWISQCHPPAPPAEIDAELEALERRIMRLLREVTE